MFSQQFRQDPDTTLPDVSTTVITETCEARSCSPGHGEDFRSEVSWVSSRGHSLEILLCQVRRLKLNGEAKVADLTVVRYQDVVKLHVKMEDAVLCKEPLRFGELGTPAEQQVQLSIQKEEDLKD